MLKKGTSTSNMVSFLDPVKSLGPIESKSMENLRGLTKLLGAEYEDIDITLKRQCILPCFRNEDVEFAFSQERHARFAKRCEHSLPIVGSLILIMLVSWGGSETRMAWHMRAVEAPLLLCYGLLWLLLKKMGAMMEAWLESAVTVTLMYFVAMVCLTPDRTAEWLDWNDRHWRPHAFMEAEATVLLCGCLAAAAVVFQLTTWRFLFLHHFLIGVYLGLAGALGSWEYNVQSRDNSLAPRMWVHVAMALRIWLIGAAIYIARLLGEIADRVSFAEKYKLEQTLFAKEEYAECVHAEQREAEEKLAAMEGKYLHWESDDSEVGDLTLASPALSIKSSAQTEDSALLAMINSRKETVPEPEKWTKPLSTNGQHPCYPNARLMEAMKGKTVDWARVRRIAESIHLEEYGLKPFFEDCIACFPELQLFVCIPPTPNDEITPQERADNEQEYQRTFGALFCVYWLLRLDDDGPSSFSYGVDETWQPHRNVMRPIRSLDYSMGREESAKSEKSDRSGCTVNSGGNASSIGHPGSAVGSAKGRPPPAMGHVASMQASIQKTFSARPAQGGALGKRLSDRFDRMGPRKSMRRNKLFSEMSPLEKRKTFFEDELAWNSFRRLVSEAGCDPSEDDSTERIMAMLCLTAFHDIMKVRQFLPTVDPSHEAYCGHAPGSKIHDHDIALAYVLEKFPDLLPSFAGLPPAQQRSILFTQGKMQFNHGWFVQAEAPPGAALSGFKQVMMDGVQKDDVAFYFFHWFTDLAGACATPLGGAEKFVLKFPHSVLKAFLWSVPFLGKLAVESETQVMKTYLQARWKDSFPTVQVPNDDASIARMRLAVMAQQGFGVVEAFDALPREAQSVLSKELSRTGAEGQHFENIDNVPKGGPAFLIYYSPAFLQQHAARTADCTLALHALTRIFMAARALWPLQDESHGTTVTINVGELRSKSLELVLGKVVSDDKSQDGCRRIWVMERLNDSEGELKLKSAAEINGLLAHRAVFCLVDFDPSTRDPLRDLPASRKLLAISSRRSEQEQQEVSI